MARRDLELLWLTLMARRGSGTAAVDFYGWTGLRESGTAVVGFDG